MNKRVFSVLSFVCVCILSLSFLHAQGTRDMLAWKDWINHAVDHGLVEGYKLNNEDYPPLSTVILYSVPGISHILNVNMFIALKVLIYFFLLLASFLFLRWTKSFYLATILHLSLILNTMALGYIDIFFLPTFIIALAAIKEKRVFLAVVSFIISFFIKWQPLIIAPFIFLHLANTRHIKDLTLLKFKQISFNIVLPGLIITSLIVGTFGFEAINSLLRATSHGFLSGNALNFNWILTYNLRWLFPDFYGPLIKGYSWVLRTHDLRITLGPRLLFIFFYGVCFVMFLKQEKTFKNLLIYSIAGYLAYFTFNIDVHENHLFLVSILGIILYWTDHSYKEMAVALVLLTNVNLFMFYGIDGIGFPFYRVVGVDLTLILAGISVIFFFMIFYALLQQEIRRPK